MIRYRFREFTLSPQRRQLLRDGLEVPLIPKYFDLLLLLVEHRHEAVHRREIFDRVWAGVIVSDSALSQAIRTIRRTLGDDPREPRFIRTVSRHGYQFVLTDVVEEAEDGADAPPALPAVERAPTSSPLPVGQASPSSSSPLSWRGAVGGAVAGIVAGSGGGLILLAAPGSPATLAIVPVLAVVGGGCGALGGGGVGAGLDAGLTLADRRPSLPRTAAAVVGGALGGGMAGALAQWLTRWALAALLGLTIPVGGTAVGIVIGAAAGAAYAMTTRRPRAWTMVTAGLCCGVAGVALSLAGYPLVGGTIHAMADATSGAQATLAPLGRLIGEPDFGPWSQSILAFGEGATFGLGLAWGLFPSRGRPHHGDLT